MIRLFYLAIVALLLATAVLLRRERVREDGWEPIPWYVCLAVFAFAFTWPAWVLAALVVQWVRGPRGSS